jgi:hypothetical protein
VADQRSWLTAAGFEATVVWQRGDLAVFLATAPAAGIVASG